MTNFYNGNYKSSKIIYFIRYTLLTLPWCKTVKLIKEKDAWFGTLSSEKCLNDCIRRCIKVYIYMKQRGNWYQIPVKIQPQCITQVVIQAVPMYNRKQLLAGVRVCVQHSHLLHTETSLRVLHSTLCQQCDSLKNNCGSTKHRHEIFLYKSIH